MVEVEGSGSRLVAAGAILVVAAAGAKGPFDTAGAEGLPETAGAEGPLEIAGAAGPPEMAAGAAAILAALDLCRACNRTDRSLAGLTGFLKSAASRPRMLLRLMM